MSRRGGGIVVRWYGDMPFLGIILFKKIRIMGIVFHSCRKIMDHVVATKLQDQEFRIFHYLQNYDSGIH